MYLIETCSPHAYNCSTAQLRLNNNQSIANSNNISWVIQLKGGWQKQCSLRVKQQSINLSNVQAIYPEQSKNADEIYCSCVIRFIQ